MSLVKVGKNKQEKRKEYVNIFKIIKCSIADVNILRSTLFFNGWNHRIFHKKYNRSIMITDRLDFQGLKVYDDFINIYISHTLVLFVQNAW